MPVSRGTSTIVVTMMRGSSSEVGGVAKGARPCDVVGLLLAGPTRTCLLSLFLSLTVG